MKEYNGFKRYDPIVDTERLFRLLRPGSVGGFKRYDPIVDTERTVYISGG